MKKTLLIALLLTLSSGMAFAQQQGGPGSPHEAMGNQGNFHAGNFGNPGAAIERLTERLGLDEAQAAEAALIFEEAQLLRDEERERNRAVADEIRNTIHARIMAMLSPEQQALFAAQQRDREQLRQALDDLRAERGFGPGPGMRNCDN
jgi:Spy/CpxP family protein refolding chaperone